MSKNLYISSLLDIYGRFLSRKQKDLAEYYYNDDLSLGEIAENEGITRQGVSDSIKRTESKLQVWEDDCGYCRKFSELRELCEKALKGDSVSLKAMAQIIEDL